MARTVTDSLRSAIESLTSYHILAKVEASKSRIFFDSIDSDYPITGVADSLGVSDTPLQQDIEYNAAAGLVTFYMNSNVVCYATPGNTAPVTTSVGCLCKPGVTGSTLYVYHDGNIKRYTIDWSLIAGRDPAPFTLSAQIPVTLTAHAVHAISSTECAVIAESGGGFKVEYISGTDKYTSDGRFMFPKYIEWDGASRTMSSLGRFSCGMRLGNKIFAYISNASAGTVEGIYYDLDTATWSNTFVAMPTEKEVSLCEFRVANGYSRNGTAYIVGQFSRSDAYVGSQPYSLVLSSSDGLRFSIDRFTLVCSIGYRFLAKVGSDNEFYISNSNRTSHTPVTWVFDGTTAIDYSKTVLGPDELKDINDSSLSNLEFSIRAGTEAFVNNANLSEGCRVKFYVGMQTALDIEYVLYGTYIIDSIEELYADGQRSLRYSCVNEGQWRLTGLSMPFYAEILGKSCMYEPFTEASGKFYPAPYPTTTRTFFELDFWKHEAYTNTTESITGISMMDGGGVRWKEEAASHKVGIITTDELKDILGLASNPKITSTTMTVNLYGWSFTSTTGQTNDEVELVLVTCDADGSNEATDITNDQQHWKMTYYDTSGTNEYIQYTIATTADKYIKKVGVVFNNTQYGTTFNVARAEFTNNVEVPYSLADSDAPWADNKDGSFKLPSSGRPFIMFAQRPYHAYNFSLSASFSNSVTGGQSGYPVAVGLVGHAQDASNYTLARYDKVSNKVQLIVARNGLETTLAEATVGWTPGEENRLLFNHRDGTFTVYMFRESTSLYELVLTYSWTVANGYMYTSAVTTMKTGIYGFISAPWVKTTGYWGGQTDNTKNADGIGIMPMESLSGWPASGNIRLGSDVLAYTSTIAKPSPVRGPYQFRQKNNYQPPFGDGYGLEAYDFDWTASVTALNDKLIAVNSGANFICSGALWQVFITTGGVVDWLHGRARYYSTNQQISKISHSLSNKVWVTGGFTLSTVAPHVSGNNLKYAAGQIGILELSGEIKCKWFNGSGGAQDITISDILKSICAHAGASASFSGDYTNSSFTVNGETLIQRDYYTDGFDLYFEHTAPTSFEIRTNVTVVPDNYEEKTDIEADTGLKLVITSLGAGAYTIKVISTPSGTEMFATNYTSGTSTQKYRVLFHGNNMSFSQNGSWIATVAFDGLKYNETDYIDVYAYTASSVNFLNLEYRELCDTRDAIYIDLETDGMSSISSTIQERPVEIYAQPDGSLDFWYNASGDTIHSSISARSIRINRNIPKDGASDAIIQSYDEVVTMQNADFGENIGFATRVMRLPSLDTGAVEATQLILKKSYEQHRQASITMRPDIRLLVGDTYMYSYPLSGTGSVKSGSLYIESINLVISANENSMTIRGRHV